MKALVIYDSFFGNTEKIAQAIGQGLGDPENVRVVKIESITAAELQGVPLIIVGSPTRAFRPSPNMAAFLVGLPDGSLKGVRAAAFDTRADVKEVNNKFLTFMAKIMGYAAEPMGKALAKKGASLVLPPEGFFITANEGPLKDGELERAAAWAQKLLS